MIHGSINCLLVVVLAVILVVGWYGAVGAPVGSEAFGDYGELAFGPFHAAPGTDGSVFSSLPASAKVNSGAKYAAPFQTACTNVGPCQKGHRYTCVLTPHNQRRCSWS
jgi:hypothetical protein